MVELSKLHEIIENLEDQRNELEVLEYVQKQEGYISKDMIKYIAEKMDKFDFSVENTVKFYPHLKLENDNLIEIKICNHTACKNNGSEKIIEKAMEILGINIEESTKDNKIKLSTQRCFGQCGKGPNVKIKDEIYNKVTPKILENLLKDYI